MRQKWVDEQDKAKRDGEREWPVIAYADFTDYEPIITRNDNWQNEFEPFFRCRRAVQGSFQRLYPIRACTMHARLITTDDELFPYVEMKRLMTAIGINMPQ